MMGIEISVISNEKVLLPHNILWRLIWIVLVDGSTDQIPSNYRICTIEWGLNIDICAMSDYRFQIR